MRYEARVVTHGVQTYYTMLRHQGLEELCVTCDNMRRYEAADTASGADQEPSGLDEEHGRLQRLASNAPVTARMAQQMHRTLRLRTGREGMPRWFPKYHIVTTVPTSYGYLKSSTSHTNEYNS